MKLLALLPVPEFGIVIIFITLFIIFSPLALVNFFIPFVATVDECLFAELLKPLLVVVHLDL